MNKIFISVVVSLIIVIIGLFLGRLVFLSQIERKIDLTKSQIKELAINRKTLDEKIKKSKHSTGRVSDSSKEILYPGGEARVFRQVLSCSPNKRLKFHSFEELTTYRIKPKKDESEAQFTPTTFGPGKKLPKLDDQGMPIGLASQDDSEWPGVTILPLKISFKSTFAGIGNFLSMAKKKLPLHGVRDMD